MDGREQGDAWRARRVSQKESGNVEGIGLDVIQAPKPKLQIMRYELTDFEWAAISSFLLNKPRGIARVDIGASFYGVLRAAPSSQSRARIAFAEARINFGAVEQ
jgi:hypothetical protein